MVASIIHRAANLIHLRYRHQHVASEYISLRSCALIYHHYSYCFRVD